MWNTKGMNVKACRCCLSAVGKLESLTELMRKVFFNICGLKAEPNDGHPQYVCTVCSALLRKALAIRRKTRRAHFVLKQIVMTKKMITREDILKVNRHSSQLVSHYGLSKPENNSMYSFSFHPIKDIPKIFDEIDKNTSMYGNDNKQQTDLGDCSKETVSVVKFTPEVCNNAAIVVDIKPDNYKELDRIEQEKLEQRKREEEEVLRQIREEDDDGAVYSDNGDSNDVNNHTSDIDLNNVFKDLKQPEIESDYSLSEPEELFNIRKKTKQITDKKDKVNKPAKENINPQVDAYNGRLKGKVELVNVWADQSKLLNVVSLAKIRHLSIEEQMKAFEIRKENIAYKAAGFKCSMCVKPVGSRELLHEHVKTDHGFITDIKCAICSGRFYDLTDLGVHQAWEHWYEYTCVCGQIHYTLEDLVECCTKKKQCSNLQLQEQMARRQHIIETRFNKILLQPQKWSVTVSDAINDIYICQYCGVEFTSENKLEIHLTLEEHRVGLRKIVECKCEVCDIQLFSVEAMEYHFSSCHSHVYKCNAKGCMSIYTRSLDALTHKCKNVYKTPLKFKKKRFCVLCGTTYTDQLMLLKHQLCVHKMIIINSMSMGDSQYVCCKTHFTNERAYHTHILIEGHEAAKDIPLACVQCKIIFTDQAEKDEHCHTLIIPPPVNKRRYKQYSKTELKCEYCQKICRSRVHLARHKSNVHYDGDICEICGKTVSGTNGAIYSHKYNVHSKSDKEVYSCQFCSEKLYSPYKLVSHMLRNHTPYPYLCAICGHRNMERFDCKQHILRVHAPEKPFECAECGARFATWEHQVVHLKKVHKITVPKHISRRPKKKVNYRSMLCYPDMRLDGSGIPMDILQKCGLTLLDYKEETETKVPPEKIADYFIFDESANLGLVSKKQMNRHHTRTTPNPEQAERDYLRKQQRRIEAKLAKSQQESENKMAADDANIKENGKECEVQNEIVVSYVRNELGEFTLKFDNKEPFIDCENAVPVPPENTNKQESKVSIKYGDAEIRSPKAEKRKHKAQHTEKSGKRVKKQTFVGTRTKPQTGKSLGIIDGFGDIVEDCNPNDLIEDSKIMSEKKVETLLDSSVTSAYDDPSDLFNQTKTSEYEMRPDPAGYDSDNKSEQNYTSGPTNISMRPNYTGDYASQPISSGIDNTSGPNNHKSEPKSEQSEDMDETRLEIDAQELADKYEIVEIDGVQYVSIDNVLYKVEYS